MFNLPAEVLCILFPLLVQRDLLECMTVCRQWYEIIGSDFLFRAILVHNYNQLNNLIERIKRDPILGENTETIYIQLVGKETHVFDSIILIDLFPNLRNLFIRNSNSFNFRKIPVELRHDHPWCKQIEKMVEGRPDPNIRAVLLSGLCPNLTYIEARGGGGSARRFIELLSNAPALKTLNMFLYKMTFNDIELLHETTPFLSSFLLDNIVFKQTSISSDIKPAFLMRSLRCTDCDFDSLDVFNPHLVYFTQKYLQLEELTLQIDPLDLSDRRSHHNPNLQKEERDMLISYLKTLAPHLKTFSLLTYNFGFKHPTGFSFNVLDESGCQIKRINLDTPLEVNWYELLAQTTQAQYIESLAAFIIIPGGVDSISFGWLTRFKMLKEVTLRFPFPSQRSGQQIVINLTDILDCLSENRLETLRLDDLQLDIGDMNRNTTHTSLKNLILSDVRFEKGTDAFISRAFPNLKSLKMDRCFQERESFILPHANLSYLEIIHQSAHEDFPTLLITLCDGQRRLYNTTTTATGFPPYNEDRNTDIFTLPYICSKPSDISDKIPTVTIVCNSVYDFVLNSAVIW